MIQRVQKVIDKIGPQNCMFKLDLSENKKRLKQRSSLLQMAERYNGDLASATEFDRLVIECVRESFERNSDGKSGKFVIDSKQTARYAIEEVYSDTLMYFEATMPQKNPKETKMYKWYRQAFIDKLIKENITNALIDIYNYRRAQYNNGFSGEEEKRKFDDNVLAVYSLIHHKNS